MAIITSTINAHVYIEILDNFLISSLENWFGDDEVIFQDIFQDRNVLSHTVKGI